LTKAVEAFRNIGEVSLELGVKKHVLRFWEAKFPQLKPMKRGGGRRLYRPSDVELLRGIQDLLDNKAYSIRGVQKILRESGVEAVKAVSKGSAAPAERHCEDTNAAAPIVGGIALSPAEVRSLRGVIAELDACRIRLGGNGSPAGARPQRSRRPAARG
jgi:DNA-binding transcriptional MerR regulator